MIVAIDWFVINNADVILGVMLGGYVALTWGRDKTRKLTSRRDFR